MVAKLFKNKKTEQLEAMIGKLESRVEILEAGMDIIVDAYKKILKHMEEAPKAKVAPKPVATEDVDLFTQVEEQPKKVWVTLKEAKRILRNRSHLSASEFCEKYGLECRKKGEWRYEVLIDASQEPMQEEMPEEQPKAKIKRTKIEGIGTVVGFIKRAVRESGIKSADYWAAMKDLEIKGIKHKGSVKITNEENERIMNHLRATA